MIAVVGDRLGEGVGRRDRRRPTGRTTTRIGSSYFRANSKSRSSCAGTAITAPVPYSPSTKLATQTGTCSPVNGLTA